MNKTKLDLYFEKEFSKSPELKEEAVKASRAIDIAMQIYTLRKNRRMTQKELAKLVGIKQSNIARLENADYSGYTMQTLNKVASALSAHLSINLVPKELEDNKTTLSIYQTFTAINCLCSPLIALNDGNKNYIKVNSIFNGGSSCLILSPNARIRATSEAKNSKIKENFANV